MTISTEAIHKTRVPIYISLQRYAVLGWALFLLTASVFVIYVFFTQYLSQMRPPVVVDTQGQILGELEYVSMEKRSDEEMRHVAKYFLNHYLSFNSTTIFEDYAQAISLMTPDLQALKLEAIKKTNYLARVYQANSRSYLVIEDKEVELLERTGQQIIVRVRGKVHIDNTTERPFDISLYMTAVPRTLQNTLGVQIDAIEDN